MKIYTKKGDQGRTSLIGHRVFKDDIRVSAYGTLDEVNSYVGYIITLLNDELFTDICASMKIIQHELFNCGADLATVSKDYKYKITPETIAMIERMIDKYERQLPSLNAFILPGGTEVTAQLHIIRTIVRRAERLIVKIARQTEDFPGEIIQFTNRLSDYFFVIARVVNFRLNVNETYYEENTTKLVEQFHADYSEKTKPSIKLKDNYRIIE